MFFSDVQLYHLLQCREVVGSQLERFLECLASIIGPVLKQINQPCERRDLGIPGRKLHEATVSFEDIVNVVLSAVRIGEQKIGLDQVRTFLDQRLQEGNRRAGVALAKINFRQQQSSVGEIWVQ